MDFCHETQIQIQNHGNECELSEWDNQQVQSVDDDDGISKLKIFWSKSMYSLKSFMKVLDN